MLHNVAISFVSIWYCVAVFFLRLRYGDFCVMKNLRILLLLFITILCLSSCRTASESHTMDTHAVRTDTLRILAHRADTLRLRDSIHVVERVLGETIRIEKHHYHTLEHTRLVRDTIHAVRTDTVRIYQAEKSENTARGGEWLTAFLIGIIILGAASLIFRAR